MMFLSLLIALTASAAGMPPDKVVITGREGHNHQIMGIFKKQDREFADRPVYYKESSSIRDGPDLLLSWSAKASRWTVGLVPDFRRARVDEDLEALGTMAFAEGDLSDPTLAKNWHIEDNGLKLEKNLQCQSIDEITKNSDAIVVHDWFWDFYGVNGVYHRQENLLTDGRPVWIKEPIGNETTRWIIRSRSVNSLQNQWCIDIVKNFDLNGLPRSNSECVTFENKKNYNLNHNPWSGSYFEPKKKPYGFNEYLHMTHFEKSAEHEPDVPQPSSPFSNPESPTPETAPTHVPEVPASSPTPEPIPAPESTPVYDWKNTLPCGKWKGDAENFSISDGHLKADLDDRSNHTIGPQSIDVIPGVCYRNEHGYFAAESIFDVPQLPFDVQLPKGNWIEEARSPRIEDGVLHCDLRKWTDRNTFMWLPRSIKLTYGAQYTVKHWEGEFALEEDDSAVKSKMLASNSNGFNLEESEEEQNRLNTAHNLNSFGSDHSLTISCMSLATSIFALIVSVYALFSRKRMNFREPLLQ